MPPTERLSRPPEMSRQRRRCDHRVVAGIDSSPRLARHADEGGGYEEVVCGDAVVLPWSESEFDLAIAYMSLHDMPDPARVIAEIARVLEPEALLCVAIVHPLNRPPEHLESYFAEQRFSGAVTRGELTMTLEGIDRPLESYTRALAASGFVIEELREPRASDTDVRQAEALSSAARKPYFLQLRCRLRQNPA